VDESAERGRVGWCFDLKGASLVEHEKRVYWCFEEGYFEVASGGEMQGFGSQRGKLMVLLMLGMNGEVNHKAKNWFCWRGCGMSILIADCW
jgi:hypothetical protein